MYGHNVASDFSILTSNYARLQTTLGSKPRSHSLGPLQQESLTAFPALPPGLGREVSIGRRDDPDFQFRILPPEHARRSVRVIVAGNQQNARNLERPEISPDPLNFGLGRSELIGVGSKQHGREALM